VVKFHTYTVGLVRAAAVQAELLPRVDQPRHSEEFLGVRLLLHAVVLHWSVKHVFYISEQTTALKQSCSVFFTQKQLTLRVGRGINATLVVITAVTG